MERFLRPYDKENMRMAMLKHEETFRKQVFELHRLYHVQKILMKDFEIRQLKNGCQNNKRWISKNENRLNQANDHYYANNQTARQQIDLEQSPEDYIAESEGNGGLENIEDESKVELTLGPSCYYGKMKEERPLNSDSSISFCSSSSSSGHRRRTNLGFPQSKCMTIEESTGQNWGLLDQIHETTKRSGFPNKGRSNIIPNIEEQSRQDGAKQPIWLFQTLSLNMA